VGYAGGDIEDGSGVRGEQAADVVETAYGGLKVEIPRRTRRRNGENKWSGPVIYGGACRAEQSNRGFGRSSLRRLDYSNAVMPATKTVVGQSVSEARIDVLAGLAGNGEVSETHEQI
jgi:hypothetical protein